MEIKTRINPAGFLEIYVDPGYYITTWNEGDDILEFYSYTICYAKLDADLSIYRVITEAENEELLAEKAEEEERRREEEEGSDSDSDSDIN